jgi:tRNA threonylcarbamoyladenosine biosynthesis protein TsaB
VLILGIETASEQVGCAIGGHEGVLASVHVSRGRRHVETLVPAIDFLCRQARVELKEIGVIAVDVGPGLFTGLRVGIAAGKAMAQALRVPMIGVSSLDLLAFPVRYSTRLIVPALDARRGEVFYSFYRQVPGGVQRLAPHQLGPPDDVVSEIVAMGQDCLVVGDGAGRYSDAFDGLTGIEFAGRATPYPSACALVELAHPKAMREEFVQPWELQPLYLRKSDAEIAWERKATG